jgi:thioredoxin 1
MVRRRTIRNVATTPVVQYSQPAAPALAAVPHFERILMSPITALTDATFDETVQGSSEPVIVDFWAEWCGPCKMITPILEEIAADHEGTLRVVKLNVDDNPDITRRFDVMSIPTLIVFQDGQAKKRLVGAKGKGQLLQELSEFL